MAFEELFRAYYNDLCAFTEARVCSPEVAEDLVQDLFLDLWRRRRTLSVRSTLRAYLFGAARNLTIKHMEHKKVRHRWTREKERQEVPRKATPDEQLWERELGRALRTCVAELPERRQMVYRLSRQHGLTYREIATVMDISPKTVENQMVRALKALRKQLRAYHSVKA